MKAFKQHKKYSPSYSFLVLLLEHVHVRAKKMHQDLYLANQCWEKHEYKDVEILLEKWEEKLSPKDRKRLEYVKRVNETRGEDAQ